MKVKAWKKALESELYRICAADVRPELCQRGSLWGARQYLQTASYDELPPVDQAAVAHRSALNEDLAESKADFAISHGPVLVQCESRHAPYLVTISYIVFLFKLADEDRSASP